MTGMIGRCPELLRTTPVDALPETNQRMAHVDQLLQINLKQLSLWLLRLALGRIVFPQLSGYLLRLQGNSRAKNAAFHQVL